MYEIDIMSYNLQITSVYKQLNVPNEWLISYLLPFHNIKSQETRKSCEIPYN